MAASKKKPYTAKDMRDVSDNPEWTKETFKKAKPFAEVFPDFAQSIRKGRGPSKTPTKKLVSLRLSPDVLDHFKAKGAGWQVEIDRALAKAAGIKIAKAPSAKGPARKRA